MKSVMITGASEGVGRAFAQRMAAEGYGVTAVARNEVRLKELIAELPGTGHAYLVADLATEAGVRLAQEKLRQSHFHVLVNNAGYGLFGAFAQADLSSLEAMMRVNCGALTALAHSFLQSAERGDALINVSSNASYLPMPVASVYTATKAFVTALSETLWYEQRARGVYVMALCPGPTRTEFNKRAVGRGDIGPKWLTQSSDQVVAIGLRALRCRRQPVVICGLQKPVIWGLRSVPRKWVIFIAGKVLDAAV